MTVQIKMREGCDVVWYAATANFTVLGKSDSHFYAFLAIYSQTASANCKDTDCGHKKVFKEIADESSKYKVGFFNL